MTFAGLSIGQMLTLFAAFAGAMLLLYILKLRRRRVEVPFSPLWARVVEERQSSSLFQALKRIFSLLVQLLMIAAIIIALGDPRLGGLSACNYEPPKPPPTRHTLLLLDASASMNALEAGQTRADRAREKAHAIIEGLGDNPNHRAMVVQVDARVRPLSLWTADRAALHAAVDSYEALDTPTEVEQALIHAEAAIRGREGAETVFVTDHAFEAIGEERVDKLGLSVETIGLEGVNVGLQAFNVRPYLDDSLSYAIFYAVDNPTDRELKARLHLYANEEGRAVEDFVDDTRLVATHPLTLPPNGVVSDVINDVKFEGSRLAARVEIAPEEPVRDVFAGDDVGFAVVPERRVLKVQLVTEGNLYLHATLFVRENVDFDLVAPADYVSPEGYDVTVIDGADVDLSHPGRYMIIDPKAREGGPFEIEGTLKEPEVKRLEKKHPIARHLRLVDLAIQEASDVAKVRGDKVVASTGGGDPLIFTRVDAATDRVFAVIAWDIKKSLLPLNYAFPLLVVNTLNWFYQEDDALLKPNRAGVEVSVAFPLEGQEIQVAGPAPVHARRLSNRAHFSADRIGIYELSTPKSEQALPVAINLMSRLESQVSPKGEYPAWQAPPAVEIETDPWLDNLWRVFLLAALLVFTLEWITWHRRITI